MNKFLVCTKIEEEDIRMYLFGPYEGEQVDGIAFLSQMEEANMGHENKTYCGEELIAIIIEHNLTDLQEDEFLVENNLAIPSPILISRLSESL